MLERELLDLEKGESDTTEVIHRLFRRAHTLKGSAFLVGEQAIGRISHSMEDCLSFLEKSGTAVDSAGVDALLGAVSTVKDLLENVGRPAGEDRDEKVAGTLKSLEEMMPHKVTMGKSEQERRQAERRQAERRKPKRVSHSVRKNLGEHIIRMLADEQEAQKKDQPPAATTPSPGDERMRVRVQHLDNLMNISGEFMIQRINLENVRNRIKRIQKDFNNIYFKLNRCANITQEPMISDRLKSLPEGKELLDLLFSIPALNLRREIQTAFDEVSVQELLGNNLISRLSTEVAQIRLLPAETIFERFELMVRELSRSLNKKVSLETHGGGTRVDRRILSELMDVLIHLIRNSIDHGIEPPHIRKKRGKPEEGHITLVLRRVGNSLEVVCEDDGAGINMALVRKEAVRRGLFTRTEARNMDEQELLHRAIMEPGFSTSRKVTDVSGRGFGMDAVKARVEKLKGDIHVDTVLNRMTRVILKVPMSVSTMDGLMVYCSNQRFIFPMNLVKETLRVSRQDLLRRDTGHYIKRGRRLIHLVHLADILGLPKVFTPGRAVLAVLVGYRDRLFAIGVDEFMGSKNVVVKTLGDHLKKVDCISGCTVIADGVPVLILEVPDIIRRTYTATVTRPIFQEEEEKEKLPVLVVDDSVTSRILEKSILEAEGFEVNAAASGEEGLNFINNNRYAAMVFDIDMPGISGVDLIGEAHKVEKNQNTPVVIVSSRDDEETIRQVYEAGARGYMNKSRFNHQQFVSMVKSLI